MLIILQIRNLRFRVNLFSKVIKQNINEKKRRIESTLVFSSSTTLKTYWKNCGRVLRHGQGSLSWEEVSEQMRNRECTTKQWHTSFHGWKDLEILLSKEMLTLLVAVAKIVHSFEIGTKWWLEVPCRPLSGKNIRSEVSLLKWLVQWLSIDKNVEHHLWIVLILAPILLFFNYFTISWIEKKLIWIQIIVISNECKMYPVKVHLRNLL